MSLRRQLLALAIILLATPAVAETRGRIVVSTFGQSSTWSALGHVAFRENSSVTVIDGETLARVIDRALKPLLGPIRPSPSSASPPSDLGTLAFRAPLWLLPLRELLSVAVMLASYTGAAVDWRGQSLHADRPSL